MKEAGKPVWVAALTPGGAETARRIVSVLPGSRILLPARLAGEEEGSFPRFSQLAGEAFTRRTDLICVMAAGIVVRGIAPFLKDKASDPAVVVVDEKGRFAVSLLSGHQGGANNLAHRVARLIGAVPVITTATDVRGLPAFDSVAAERGWKLENATAVRDVHMALLEGRKIALVDPCGRLSPEEAGEPSGLVERFDLESVRAFEGPTVYVGVEANPGAANWLMLRPKELAAGVGCNRGTSAGEILDLIRDTFREEALSPHCLAHLASIDAKRDEPGLLEAARSLGVECLWYPREILSTRKTPNPSEVVRKHMGVKSVCEAAAMLAAGTDLLLVSKRKTRNVTLAVARVACGS